jgi:hypothetical protein
VLDSVLLLGGTDATLAVAEAVLATGVRLRAIVVAGEKFSISYSAREMNNFRSVDLEGWGAKHGVQVLPYRSYDHVLACLGYDMPDICLVAVSHGAATFSYMFSARLLWFSCIFVAAIARWCSAQLGDPVGS